MSFLLAMDAENQINLVTAVANTASKLPPPSAPHCLYIGGAAPSRPTLMAGAMTDPSGIF
jgi:hypothetical protein